jgi:hypothetical protein
MRNYDVDPLVLLTALLMQPKRKPAPPTPEQIARRQQEDERARWNDEVVARKAAKKGSK